MWLLLPIVLSTLVFYPILRNYFFGDDLYFLYHLVNASLPTFLLTPYGGHLFVARNFVLLCCHQLFGTAPQGYFAVALVLHLVNVALLYGVIRTLTQSRRLAAFGAALWGSAALHEGTLGWISAHGIVMVGTATLWLLYDLARTHTGRSIGTRRMLLWPVLLFIASTSFGVGLAVSLGFPLAALTMHAHQPGKARVVLCSVLSAGALVAAYFTIQRMMLDPDSAAAASSTLTLDALMNPWPLLAMIRDLAGFGLFSLIFGDAAARLGYTEWAGMAAIVGVGTIFVIAALRGDWPTRGILFGCTALALAVFVAVAAGRGPLWGTKFYLATRYQYVPLIAAVIALCRAMASIDARHSISSAVKNGALCAWLFAAIAIHFTLSPGIDQHEQARRATTIEINEMLKRIRGTPAGQDVYIPNQMFHGVGPLMMRNPKMFPGWAAAFAVFFPSNVVEGRRVFFVESDAETRDAAKDGRRSSSLIVAPPPSS